MSDFNSELGMTFGDDPGTVLLDTTRQHEAGPGIIHFAVLATLAEVSAARTVGAPVVPASIHLNLLAAAAPGRLRATGRLLRRGGRLVVAEGEVTQGEKLVAKATVTFSVL